LFDIDEIEAWEVEQHNKYLNAQNKFKRDFDPRIKKFNEFRNHRRTKHYYNHEVKWIRKLTQRRFRMKFKNNFDYEEYFRPVPHDYRTNGWLSY
jgi:hypothetical protein